MLLAQSVLTDDLVYRETTHSRQRAAAIGNRHSDQDLACTWGVIHVNLHGIEVTSNICGILVPKRDVNRRTWSSHLLGRRYQGCASFHRSAKWLT